MRSLRVIIPMVQGVVLVTATIYVLINTFTDLLVCSHQPSDSIEMNISRAAFRRSKFAWRQNCHPVLSQSKRVCLGWLIFILFSRRLCSSPAINQQDPIAVDPSQTLQPPSR